MTNLEALKTAVAGYPLSDDTYRRIMTDNSINEYGTYAGKTQAFELAIADLYTLLATAVNVTEGGFSVSVTDRANFLKQAEAIRDKYDVGEEEDNPQPVVRAKNVW